MKNVQIIVKGSSEEVFVNDALVKHFAPLNIFIASRKILTGWDRINKKPAKGGLLKYIKFKNDVLRWIESDRGRAETFHPSFIDLYAFPKDAQNPYTKPIQNIVDCYQRIEALEAAITWEIDYPDFIPYVHLHEFVALLLVDPDRSITMYPDEQRGINKLKRSIGNTNPEEINESPSGAPSKRIIQYLLNYEGQKAQVGPLVEEDIGLLMLRNKCPHFNDWITKLENI